MFDYWYSGVDIPGTPSRAYTVWRGQHVPISKYATCRLDGASGSLINIRNKWEEWHDL